MGGDNNNEQQINRLIAELSECREDERSSQNQILQTISAGGALLAVVFGASFLKVTKHMDACLLVLSLIIFYVCICNIINLGINNVLRFHYIRDVEDRLSELIKDREGREFVGWMSLSSVVNTRNIFHIFNSKYTLISYIFYAVMTVLAVVFCSILTFFQYYFISEKSMWMVWVMILHTLFTIVTMFFFVWISFNANDMYNLSYRKSLFVRKKRTAGNLISRNINGNMKVKRKNCIIKKRDIKRAVLYYIFPKTKDFQKSIIVMAGFLTGHILDKGFKFEFGDILNLILTWVIIEFLMYQGRYLLNDIRGVDEDVKEGKKSRLPVYIGHKRAIVISLFVIFFRIISAFFLAVDFGGDIKISLAIGMICIVAATVFYETVRAKDMITGIFLAVGIGYPLRFFAGFLTAYNTMFNAFYFEILCNIRGFCTSIYNIIYALHTRSFGVNFGLVHLVLLLAAYLFMGIFSAAIPWVYEAIHHKYNNRIIEKTHLNYLFNKAQDYYNEYIYGNDVNEKGLFPLREKGKILDIWNLAFILAVASISGIRLIYCFNFITVLFEIFVVIVSAAVCRVSYKLITVISEILILSVSVWSIATAILYRDWGFYVFASVNQIVIMLLYYNFRYNFDPQFNFITECRKIFKRALIFIIGEDGGKYI